VSKPRPTTPSRPPRRQQTRRLAGVDDAGGVALARSHSHMLPEPQPRDGQPGPGPRSRGGREDTTARAHAQACQRAVRHRVTAAVGTAPRPGRGVAPRAPDGPPERPRATTMSRRTTRSRRLAAARSVAERRIGAPDRPRRAGRPRPPDRAPGTRRGRVAPPGGRATVLRRSPAGEVSSWSTVDAPRSRCSASSARTYGCALASITRAEFPCADGRTRTPSASLVERCRRPPSLSRRRVPAADLGEQQVVRQCCGAPSGSVGQARNTPTCAG